MSWANFLTNSDTEFHATRCQTQSIKESSIIAFSTVPVPTIRRKSTSTTDDDTYKKKKDRTTATDDQNEKRQEEQSNIIVCGTSDGMIRVYQLSKSLKPKSRRPLLQFKAHKGPIYCLKWSPQPNQLLLITGADEELKIWDWDTIEAQIPTSTTIQPLTVVVEHQSQYQCDVQLGSRQISMPRSEINSLLCVDNSLFAGGGDGCIYQWDIQTEQLSQKFRDPDQKKNVYVMTLNRTSTYLLSGHSDGSLKFWDVKTGQVIKTMYPLSEDGTQKEDDRTWISRIAIDQSESWMVVGGGACYATLWYVPQMTLSAVMPTSAVINDICFTNDEIVIVGNESNVYFYNRGGKYRAHVKTGIVALFSVERIEDLSTDAVVVSGIGSQIDIVVHDKTISLQF
ncbi:Thoc6 [Acrasis kona]|uniref:Thoc6 n=1 Tax=Acrasis kona TaxID=1008807 RepID=A0AAW2ZJY2_9EUKA